MSFVIGSKANFLAWLSLFLALILPDMARAEEDKFSAAALNLPDQAYVSGWFIDPGPVTLPVEPLKGGDPILKTVFFPYKSFALDGAFDLGGTKGGLSKGTELVGFIAHRPTACTQKAISRTAAQALLLKGGTKHLCFVDSDSDGKFDRRFFLDNGGSLYRHQALIPKEAAAIEPLSYHETDPKRSPVSGYLSLFYYAHHSWVKEFSIGFAYLRNDGSNPQTDGVSAYSFKDKEIPLTVKLFGGSYRVERMEKGRILVRSEGVQPLTPVHIGTMCCQ